MCGIDNLRLDIKALPEGDSAVTVRLGGDFFSAMEASDITQGDVRVDVSIRKTAHFSDVTFRAIGTVEIPCDRCLDPMEQPVDARQHLTVKFGSEYSEDDDLITVTEDNSVLDLSWLVCEAVILSLPVKHVHAPGKCNRAMIQLLSEHSATRSDDTAGEQQETDPRWSALEELKQRFN
ncbi:MAG: DUF177 domain-containing protein [Bacteroidales bacterium]|nr:DUF177 domain-containing protein [Bacteroidales bacterium]MCM1148410.1 DUF177 domain-containing protein [Bacteroidales bacterium]MCM1205056.1 DUF177 domain-containing protein [Bacillota bacterium]MCM1511403.1 DUF177 domain-containing protein [Clostridium sp.]